MTEPRERRNHDSLKQNKFIKSLKSMFVWYPNGYSKAEKRLLFKLDLSLLVYGCLSFFVKSLDSSNITNAYVSGMKEDLSLYGNELNWLQITYLLGYVIGQVPFLVLMSRPKFSKYVLPTLEVLYGICTFAQSRIVTVNQLYAVRFLLGLLEAPSFTGVHQTLGFFYGTKSYKGNSTEIYVRSGTWFLSSHAANMFSGYLQSAAYTNLSGVNGLKGWQWLFIIDGIITLPIALIGYAFWPGLPESGKPWYLTDDEYKLVLKRTERYKVSKAGKLDRDVLKRTFTQWKWYVCVFGYICMLLGHHTAGYMSLWLKAQKRYSVVQINNYPTAVSAISIVTSFVGASLAAVYSPWKIFMISITGGIVQSLIMTIYNVPTGLVFFAFYASGLTSCGSPILYASVNRILKNDPEQKSIVMGSMMGIGYFVYTWAPLGLFPTGEKYGERAAPRWKIGYPASLGFNIAMALSFLAITWLDKRDRRKRGEVENVEDDVVYSDDEEEEEVGEEYELTNENVSKGDVKEVIRLKTNSISE
ncbi:putative transporter SEO1 [Wickerhamomyces ciferrii]|uniref:Transporter SEO1 n=1 Tax=Wickerhamomyces ciferrii (strain ATCC 14091 / BCRC 22168 / CBS 111 / JCM 3599 / NBRC 0793 / NRRL Y-1031 F-60-10) TaxID=1206466 RepID=K0KVD4_WICCF|nr:putative transporter SEO1 [Wickerhamomyces ciferrii]CCH45113.1 putative transporter SEO1 [Wickerhamomyces ciferrii]